MNEKDPHRSSISAWSALGQALIVLGALSGCSLFGAAPIPCDTDGACPPSLVCRDAVCKSPVVIDGPDGGDVIPVVDAGPKIVPDGGTDAGPAPRDGGPEPGPDAGPDAGPDDAGVVDAGVDAGPNDAGVWHEANAQLRRDVTLQSVSGDVPAGTLLRLRTPSDLGAIRLYLRDGTPVSLETSVVSNQDEDDVTLSIFRAPAPIASGESVNALLYFSADGPLSDDDDPSLPDRRVVVVLADDLNDVTLNLPGDAQTPFIAVGSSSLNGSLARWDVELGDDDITASAGVNARVDSAYAGVSTGGEQLRVRRVLGDVRDVAVVALALPAQTAREARSEAFFGSFGNGNVAGPGDSALGLFRVRTENNPQLAPISDDDNSIRLTLDTDGTTHTFDAYGLNTNTREAGLVVTEVDDTTSIVLSGQRSPPGTVGSAGADTIEVDARYVLRRDIDVREVDMTLVNRQAQAEVPELGVPAREGVVLVTGRATLSNANPVDTRITVVVTANGETVNSQANLVLRDEQIDPESTLRPLARVAPYRGSEAINVSVDVENDGTTLIEDLKTRVILLHEVSTTLSDDDEPRPQ